MARRKMEVKSWDRNRQNSTLGWGPDCEEALQEQLFHSGLDNFSKIDVYLQSPTSGQLISLFTSHSKT